MNPSTSEQTSTTVALPAATRIGIASLRVADRERSIAFYRDFLGFSLLEERGQYLIFGVGSTPLLSLEVVSGIRPRQPRTSGLYHVAILVPDRLALANSLWRIAERQYPLGAGDHFVSEALYISDPDDNGLEIYRDRPRETWQWLPNGLVNMGTEQLDLVDIMREVPETAETPTPMREGTTIGHVHLQVGDLREAEAFYVNKLGFEVVQRLPGALFISAGRYHHHIGLNVWQSRGVARAPENTANMQRFEVVLPSETDRQALRERLDAQHVEVREDGAALVINDPWGMEIALIVG